MNKVFNKTAEINHMMDKIKEFRNIIDRIEGLKQSICSKSKIGYKSQDARMDWNSFLLKGNE